MTAETQPRELIGLIPAAGTAKRISPLPCSKEILPIGYHRLPGQTGPRPKVVAQYTLDKMKSAGARKAFIILRKGKWDIAEYFGCGKSVGLDIAYLIMDLPHGPPYTLDQAFPFASQATILFGFPDILFAPHDAYGTLVEQISTSKADVVLGLFAARNPSKMDMVQFDGAGKICGLDIKPAASRLTHTWIIAVWSPVFSRYMHQYVQTRSRKDNDEGMAGTWEAHVGDVIHAAIQDGLNVDTVFFNDGDYLDIGTPEDLVRAESFARKYD